SSEQPLLWTTEIHAPRTRAMPRPGRLRTALWRTARPAVTETSALRTKSARAGCAAERQMFGSTRILVWWTDAYRSPLEGGICGSRHPSVLRVEPAWSARETPPHVSPP